MQMVISHMGTPLTLMKMLSYDCSLCLVACTVENSQGPAGLISNLTTQSIIFHTLEWTRYISPLLFNT